MDSNTVKKVLKLVADNKDSINMMLDGLDSNAIENGTINVSDKIIRTSVEAFDKEIQDASEGMLKKVDVAFRNNKVILDAKIKKVLTFHVNYSLMIKSLKFNKDEHIMTIAYKAEGVTFTNILIGLLLKFPAIRKNVVQEGISWNGKKITVFFDRMVEESIPSWLTLTYISSEAGVLKFGYSIEDEPEIVEAEKLLLTNSQIIEAHDEMNPDGSFGNPSIIISDEPERNNDLTEKDFEGTR